MGGADAFEVMEEEFGGLVTEVGVLFEELEDELLEIGIDIFLEDGESWRGGIPNGLNDFGEATTDCGRFAGDERVEGGSESV